MNAKEIMQEALKRPIIFQDETKLSVNYVPMHLPFREVEIQKLTHLFRGLLENPGGSNLKILIVGASGTGKTAVVKTFGTWIQAEAKKKQINLQYVPINCRRDQTPHMVLVRMIKAFDFSFPRRGFNEAELLHILFDEILKKRDAYLLVCLDDADQFLRTYPSMIYNLMRIEDELLNPKQRISLILIAKDQLFLSKLDEGTRSTFQCSTIPIEKYAKLQIQEILRSRIREAFFEGTVLVDTVKLISDFVADTGDARYALELLWLAGKYAEEENVIQISAEFVRRAANNLHPSFKREVLEELSLQQQLALLAIVYQLKVTQRAYVTMGDCLRMYNTLCEDYSVKPRSHTQFWNYIQSLVDFTGIVSKDVTTLSKVEERPGRTTLIRLNVCTKDLEPILIKELESVLEMEVSKHVESNESKLQQESTRKGS